MKSYYYCPKYRKLTQAMKIIALNLYNSDGIIEFTDKKPWENIEFFQNSKVYFYDAVDMFPEVHPYISINNDFSNAQNDDLEKIDFSKLADRCFLLKQNNIEIVFERGSQCSFPVIDETMHIIMRDAEIKNKDSFSTALYKNLLQHSIYRYLLEKKRLSAYSLTHRIASELNETHIGAKKGQKVTTKKSIEMKEKILKLSRDFNGDMRDIELMKELNIARNTYYKYKRELHNEKHNQE